MPTPKELLEKLEERFILGEVNEENYEQLKAKLLAKIKVEAETPPAPQPASPGQAPAASPPAGFCCVSGKPVDGKEYFVCDECKRPCLEEFRVEHPEGRVIAMCRACGEPMVNALLERKRVEEAAREEEENERKRVEAAAKKAERARQRRAEEKRRLEEEERRAEEKRFHRQEQERRRLVGKPGQNWTCELGDGVHLEMIWIPPGNFEMGYDERMDSRRVWRSTCISQSGEPVHRVNISRGFWLGKYPVTEAQYKAVRGNSPSRAFKGADHPVVDVSWHMANRFCGLLTKKLGLVGVKFRLPSEAEWEYACRAGSTGVFCFGDDYDRLGEYAWYEENSGRETQPVGKKRANGWGLHDMHGNVWEWCKDAWQHNYEGAPTDGRARLDGKGLGGRVRRGGSWDNNAFDCRGVNRTDRDPSDRDDHLGFRLLRIGPR